MAANWMSLLWSRWASDQASDGPEPELDALHGVGLVGDGLLLLAAEVGLGLPQDLEEQLLLRVEVPVEDALADAQAGHDLRHRRRVVALLGEAGGRERHQLVSAVLATLGESPCHDGPNRTVT